MTKAKVAEAVEALEATEVTVRGVDGFFEKIVTRFGTGAKIDCPKKYLGRTVFVVVRRTDRDSPEGPGEPLPSGALRGDRGPPPMEFVPSEGGPAALAPIVAPVLASPLPTRAGASGTTGNVPRRRSRARGVAVIPLGHLRPVNGTGPKEDFQEATPLSLPP